MREPEKLNLDLGLTSRRFCGVVVRSRQDILDLLNRACKINPKLNLSDAAIDYIENLSENITLGVSDDGDPASLELRNRMLYAEVTISDSRKIINLAKVLGDVIDYNKVDDSPLIGAVRSAVVCFSLYFDNFKQHRDASLSMKQLDIARLVRDTPFEKDPLITGKPEASFDKLFLTPRGLETTINDRPYTFNFILRDKYLNERVHKISYENGKLIFPAYEPYLRITLLPQNSPLVDSESNRQFRQDAAFVRWVIYNNSCK